VEAFPARLQTETGEAASRAERTTEAKLHHQMLLAQKDAEAERRIAELQVKTLTESLAQKSAQIAELQRQLDDAKRQVQDIAVKAIEGASGATALQHVNQIAVEQAKTRVPQ
jgi:hypothetical protein